MTYSYIQICGNCSKIALKALSINLSPTRIAGVSAFPLNAENAISMEIYSALSFDTVA